MNSDWKNGTHVAVTQSCGTPSEATVDDRLAWHRPVVTIIDIRRTMFGAGAYFDGINLSTFSS